MGLLELLALLIIFKIFFNPLCHIFKMIARVIRFTGLYWIMLCITIVVMYEWISGNVLNGIPYYALLGIGIILAVFTTVKNVKRQIVKE
ncbi:hypothetical protein HFN12_14320 [Faecalicatena fissicatena]|uniref:hypothetical protein n=1 Tax=Faecalicatena fissicatena TaxID=290055 RepID=UPI00156F8FA0|nr:hypothetical protein [Faecalicatena fissicatena]NSD83917.1 hypothetical protein [Faecalicatena fissicatena]